MENFSTPVRCFRTSIVGISGHSRNWKLKKMGTHSESVSLNSSETVRLSVKCLSSTQNKETKNNRSKIFSLMTYGSDLNEPEIISSEIFANLARISLPALTAIAELPAPNADCAPPEIHKSLQQFLDIKDSNVLDMVVTVHWRCRQHFQGREPTTIFGQHNLLLENLGDTVVAGLVPPMAKVPDPCLSVLSSTRIIPVDAPVLPTLPTDFALSVGLDVARGDGGNACREEGCLTVAQATSLFHDKEVDVSKDLSREELDNCVKVTAECVSTFQHDFNRNK